MTAPIWPVPGTFFGKMASEIDQQLIEAPAIAFQQYALVTGGGGGAAELLFLYNSAQPGSYL